ncbi:MAG: hypothetical protein AABY00_03825 [Nanoarchaeota archaeon]
MDLRETERYIERTLDVTRATCQKYVERELSIDGLCKRLSQFADILYLGVIFVTFPVGVYSINKAISLHHEHLQQTQRVDSNQSQILKN